MTETLFRAYMPLLLWPGLGLLLFRLLPQTFPRLLGRALYWVGVPLELFSLARRADFSGSVGLTPGFVVVALFIGLILAEINWRGLSWSGKLTADGRASRGSLVLCSILGNTGFVGLAIAPILVGEQYLSWIVFYSIVHNIIGTYGLGVFCASRYGRANTQPGWWRPLRDVLTVPSLWGFALGLATRSLFLPEPLEVGLHRSIWVIIPCALVLMGMRLSQVQGWKSVKLAIFPTLTRVLLTPLLIGLMVTALGISGDARLALVLMSGMPSAFASLILAEEYDLDRDLVASGVALSSIAIIGVIPLWLVLFTSS
ncbi:MAG: AEC family transporter [Thainema sp.]